MRDISVLVAPGTGLDAARQQTRSLDAQTLSSDAFEVVVDGRTMHADALEFLQQLARHRPNLRVVIPETDEDLLTSCEGTYVLPLTATDVLFPTALKQLRDAADTKRLDLVIGRVVEGMRPVPTSRWTDRVVEHLGEFQGPGESTANEVVLIRCSIATTSASGVVAGSAAVRVGVLARCPVSRRAPAVGAVTTPPGDRVIALDAVVWSRGQLELRITASGADIPLGTPRAVVLLQHTVSLDTRLVAAHAVAEGTAEVPIWRVQVNVDPLAEANRLPSGVWQLLLQLGDPADQPSAAIVPVPWATCPPALVAKVALVPASLQGRFVLDVGAVTYPLITATNPNEGSVVETALGSLMVLQLPSLHVHATGTLNGYIAQDTLRMPAKILVDAGRARLEAYVSGPKSLSTLSTEFGSRRLQPTGLTLDIDGEGAMRLLKTKPSAPPRTASVPPKPKPKPDPGQPKSVKKKAKPTPKPRQGLVARMRRAVPGPLEPLVKRVARFTGARRLYRRITH